MRAYIAATSQNEGKTVVSVGLINSLKKRLEKVGYIKPVGQQYVVINDEEIDKDAVLVKEVYNLPDKLKYMSPLAIPKGFTENYILRGNREELVNRIRNAYKNISLNKEVVVIEGTGHAGVGSIFDLSNAEVCRLLNAKVILVSCGGIGRPVDQIMLNKAMFDVHGIELLGVIINKVYPDKYKKIKNLIQHRLERENIELLGVIPYNPILSSPTMRELLEDLGGSLISGEEDLDNVVNRIVVGAMPPHEALNYFGPGTLLVTPGNREDIILAAMSGCLPGITKAYCISGLILTCGVIPHKNVMNLIGEIPVPVIMVEDDTFVAANKVHGLIVKIRSTELHKIRATQELVENYVNVDRIVELLKEDKKRRSKL